MSKTETKEITTIKDLIPDDLNANLGSQRGRVMIETSLKKHGAGRSVLVDKNGKLIAGNKTAEAAGGIGLDGVIVVQSDGKKLVVVQRTDLDLDENPEARELGVLDNRTSEISLHWDAAALLRMQANGVDLSAAFFSGEIDAISSLNEQNSINQFQEPPSPEEFPAYDENINTNLQCPKCSYEWSGKPQ